jgi:hypothetical protein
MLVIKAIVVGAATGVVAIALYLVVAVLIPVAVGMLESSVDGGGMGGFSISIELGLLVAVIGFFAGFGWTLLRAWPARERRSQITRRL